MRSKIRSPLRRDELTGRWMFYTAGVSIWLGAVAIGTIWMTTYRNVWPFWLQGLFAFSLLLVGLGNAMTAYYRRQMDGKWPWVNLGLAAASVMAAVLVFV